ncbi:Alpha-2-macroglobulin receptor-associated protein [Liparis tanakae]|uniref:Alpha-2-macroglobulin receptor-associated protein n=1 Tax=Liparis tanakae TaxID=230148 RepID=A0A4Z2FMK3_9TELE|nr:Alpha-2-macroglobulin receptor-associated protein [Liparis tanakae]
MAADGRRDSSSLKLLQPINLKCSFQSTEELRHFETKVEKHSHYQEQLELSHQKLQHVESLGDEEHIKRNREKYDTLAGKTREMGYKMKKHMQDLSNKISREGLGHNEL